MQALFFFAVVMVYSLFACVLVIRIVDGHRWAAALTSMVASPGMLIIAGVLVEGRSFWRLVNPTVQSWAALFGDLLVLSGAVFVLALAWQRVASGEIYIHPAFYTRWYVAGCVVMAIGVAWLYRDGEVAGYMAAGTGDVLWSPTKVIHDFGIYPMFVGVLVGMSLPLLWRNPRKWPWQVWAVWGCFAIWLVLVIIDTNRGLDPFSLHPLWDVDTFTPRSR